MRSLSEITRAGPDYDLLRSIRWSTFCRVQIHNNYLGLDESRLILQQSRVYVLSVMRAVYVRLQTRSVITVL
jgi:hypothetical protein